MKSSKQGQRLFAVVLALGLSTGLPAAQTNNGVANVAAPWLQGSGDARSAALAANTAVPKGLGALGDNVAGLGGVQGWQVGLGHTLGLESTSLEHGALAWGNGKSGVGLGVDYLSFGSVDSYTVVSNQLVPGSAISPYAATATLGGAHRFGSVSIGAAAKWVSQSLDGSQSASTFAGDLGALWSGKGGISLGLAAQNVGGQLDGANLPGQVKAGAGYQKTLGKNALLLAADYVQSLVATDGSANQIDVGGEWLLRETLALRAGYSVAQRGSLSGSAGLSAGLGVHVGAFTLSYAYSGLGDLGANQHLSLEAGF